MDKQNGKIKTMHIIFLQRFTPSIAYGGAEISAWYTARGLVELGHKVEIFCEGSRSTTQKEKDGIIIHALPRLFGRNVLTLERLWAKKQAKILQKNLPKNFDLLHSHDQHSLLINGELKIRAQRIHTIRDYTPICGYNHLKIDNSICPKCSLKNFLTCPKIVKGNALQKPLRIFRFLITLPYHQKILASLDGVVFISSFLKKEILNSPNWRKRINKPKKTAVIYNPLPQWQIQKKETSKKETTLLFIGRLAQHKGLDLLLKALQGLDLSFKLIIVGQGQIKYYQKLAQKLKLPSASIKFLGQIPHNLMPHIYQKADIVVSPHLWPEPFGRTLIEGMALGKIVISSSLGAAGEIITHQKNGLLIPPANAEILRKTILKISRNQKLKQKIEERAKNNVRKRFTPQKIAQDYLKFYKSVT